MKGGCSSSAAQYHNVVLHSCRRAACAAVVAAAGGGRRHRVAPRLLGAARLLRSSLSAASWDCRPAPAAGCARQPGVRGALAWPSMRIHGGIGACMLLGFDAAGSGHGVHLRSCSQAPVLHNTGAAICQDAACRGREPQASASSLKAACLTPAHFCIASGHDKQYWQRLAASASD